MTAHRDLKKIIRTRQEKTGESYTTARAQILRARAERLERPDPLSESDPEDGSRVDAVVLKVGEQSARVRIFGEEGQVTFRTTRSWWLVPGLVITLVLRKRWTWRGDAYASGTFENPRIDVPRLELTPLPLRLYAEKYDLRSAYEPFEDPDPYAPRWRELTAEPRVAWDFDPIAWGTFPDEEPEESLMGEATELVEAGDFAEARDLLMKVLLCDLRCLDAHAHLGHMEFPSDPRVAILHYEVGVRIGELSLPPGFDGVLIWGRVDNRPFLRCLHGYGLCLWRLGRPQEALAVFERILAFNPNDNQGVRFLLEDLERGRTWEESRK